MAHASRKAARRYAYTTHDALAYGFWLSLLVAAFLSFYVADWMLP